MRKKGDGLMAAEKGLRKGRMRHGFGSPQSRAAPAGITGAALSDGGAKGNGPPSGFVASPGKSVRNGLGSEADFSYWQC